MYLFNGYLPLVIRVVQIPFAAYNIGFNADQMHGYRDVYEIFGLAVATIATVWYLLTVTPVCKFIPPIASISFESLLAPLWLVPFGLMFSEWGHQNCNQKFVHHFYGDRTRYVDKQWSRECRKTKVSMSFYFISFALQLLVIVLLSVRSIYPAIVNKTLLRINYFSLGTIFPQRALVKSDEQFDEKKTVSLNVGVESKDSLGHSSIPIVV